VDVDLVAGVWGGEGWMWGLWWVWWGVVEVGGVEGGHAISTIPLLTACHLYHTTSNSMPSLPYHY
jgi:hypothetical protein